MEEFGDFFPENPQSLDELLEQMARRMAAMQAMMNSMTPEQRAQLQQLSDQLLEDMDLRWQMSQLGQNLQSMYPEMGWGQGYQFEGSDPMGMGQAMQTMQELGDLDRFTSPGEMIEATYRHIRYYNHRRIHTALRMPPTVYAAQAFSDTGLHVLGT